MSTTEDTSLIPADLEKTAARFAPEYVEFGEVNTTKLSEAVAEHYGHDEWCDDPEHPVWEAALFAEDVWIAQQG